MKSLCVLCVIVFASACGGPETGPTTPDKGGGGGGKTSANGDVSIDIAIDIKGAIVFEPAEALGRPGMPMYYPKNTKLTVDQQKKIFGTERDPLLKQAQGAVLATMLFAESKNLTGDAQKAKVEEARQVLRTAAAAAKDKVDEVTLRLQGSYELQVDDYAAAEKAWEELVKKFPKTKEILYNKGWWAVSLVKQGKYAEALAVVKQDQPTEKEAEHAYITAWVRYLNGDAKGALEAMAMAFAGWGQNQGKELLDRDAYLFASRSNLTMQQAAPLLYGVFNAKQPAMQSEVLIKLGERAYQYAGKWADAVGALQEALKVAGGTTPAFDKVFVNYNIAQFTVPLDQPDAAARAAKESIGALPGCGAKCSSKDREDLVTAIYGIARTFHLLYSTANDIRYYQPAHDLYELTVPIMQNNANRAQAQADVVNLEKTLKNTKVGTGTHDKQAISVLLGRHNQEVQACYESALIRNSKIAGPLTLTLDSDATGVIKGAASEPKGGTTDMSAVAACAVEAAKTWKLPKRGMAGTTRIKIVYTLAHK
jgi:tetratricopeptide (TPR) repeat protein